MQYSDEKDMQKFKKVNSSSWDTLRDNVYLRLINAKYLNKYGEDIAYQKYLDLAIVFSVQEKSNKLLLTHMLTNEELAKYNVSVDDVYKNAVNNTANDRKRRILTFKESTIKDNPMYPVLTIPNGMTMGAGKSMQNCGIIEDVDPEDGSENILMLCNKHDTFGASYMAVLSILEEVFERFDNEEYYIIPLSVHSAMCVRSSHVTKGDTKPRYEVEDDLLDMIESINDSSNKSWKDILTYRIYYYYGNDGKTLFSIK